MSAQPIFAPRERRGLSELRPHVDHVGRAHVHYHADDYQALGPPPTNVCQIPKSPVTVIGNVALAPLSFRT